MTSPSPNSHRLSVLLDHLRLNGLLARAVKENNSQDYIRTLVDTRKLCDTAIAQHTFRVYEFVEDVEDDEL